MQNEECRNVYPQFFILHSAFCILMIKLIVTDIDGTLLDYNGDLAPGNAEALAAAHDRGVRLVLATVRKRDSTEFVAQAAWPALHAGLPGRRRRSSTRTGAALRSLSIPLELARSIAALADEHRLPLMVTVDELNYSTP